MSYREMEPSDRVETREERRMRVRRALASRIREVVEEHAVSAIASTVVGFVIGCFAYFCIYRPIFYKCVRSQVVVYESDCVVVDGDRECRERWTESVCVVEVRR